MARSVAYINVTCDYCGSEELDIELVPLAIEGTWEEESIEDQLKAEGWTRDLDNNDVCPDCVEDAPEPVEILK